MDNKFSLNGYLKAFYDQVFRVIGRRVAGYSLQV